MVNLPGVLYMQVKSNTFRRFDRMQTNYIVYCHWGALCPFVKALKAFDQYTDIV